MALMYGASLARFSRPKRDVYLHALPKIDGKVPKTQLRLLAK